MQKLEISAFDAWYLKNEISLEEADSVEEVARRAYQAGLEAAQPLRALDAKLACPLCGGSGSYRPAAGVRVE